MLNAEHSSSIILHDVYVMHEHDVFLVQGLPASRFPHQAGYQDVNVLTGHTVQAGVNPQHQYGTPGLFYFICRHVRHLFTSIDLLVCS